MLRSVHTELSVSDDLGFVDESDTQTHTGWTVGGGAEYAFTDNVIGRLEYRYTDYGSKGFSAAGDFVNFDANLKTNEVVIGVSYSYIVAPKQLLEGTDQTLGSVPSLNPVCHQIARPHSTRTRSTASFWRQGCSDRGRYR